MHHAPQTTTSSHPAQAHGKTVNSKSTTAIKNKRLWAAIKGSQSAADLIEATKNLRQKSKERPVKWDISHASDPMTAHDRLCIQQHRVRLANRWMTEGNIVRNEKEGDVGVVMDVSYSRHDKPKKGNGKADHIATTSSGAKVHVYMHVKVALPNGKETTWREAQLTALSASDGFREIVSRMTV